MRNTHSKLATSFFVVLATLVVSGVFTSAMAEDLDKKEVVVKPGETVEVEDGDTVVIDASTETDAVAKAKDKANVTSKKDTVSNDAKPASAKAKESVVKPMMVMEDDFSSKNTTTEDPVDADSVVELALRGVLTPTGPAIGGTLGFSWRFANRFRAYAGFNAGKALLDLKGQEKELVQLGFTAGVSRVVTRTVEVGLFGTASWSYRDMTKDISASFLGVGPGFRVNKFAGTVFFEAGLPVGFSKKFAGGELEWNMAVQVSTGFHF